ncbi:MetQ/NlpA family ABC transporter substrate-binding protein [Bacillus kwashiorkori]|uniref:MetQ/NlpA family ABC transporter substrate-binding protein n=1 Tax=Bacillus kwashiorkori TaxID=1522318 RepID=UPI000785B91F|nr:MetQ/NlpA family ABC transporter substrate-binding protein [Bacillus kwashiorkori]
MKKRLIVGILLIASVFILGACGEKTSGENVVKIGVTGSDGQVWDVIKKKAAAEGIEIQLVEFNDYTLPNKALADGDIDLNAFQHIAFLNQFIKEHKLDLVPIGTTQIAPMGIYSSKLKSVEEMKQGAKIAIPDDPSNQARALKVLQSAGLIKLKEDFGLFGDVSGVVENPKNVHIIPMTAQQTPRVLDDVAISVINNGVAGQAGFVPNEDAIFLEDPNDKEAQPYINIFAARAAEKDNEVYQKIVAIYHDPEVVEKIKKDTNGGSIVVNIPIEQLEDVIQ